MCDLCSATLDMFKKTTFFMDPHAKKIFKYKGNFDFFVFRFFGFLMNVFTTLKQGAPLMRSYQFHTHPY